MSEETKIDGRTKRALDIALAKRLVSQGSYRAVLAGELSLADAKELGRNGAPGAPSDAAAATERATETAGEDARCWCGCGGEVRPGRRWRQGHDARAKGIILRAVRAGKTDGLPEPLRAYGVERGLLDA